MTWLLAIHTHKVHIMGAMMTPQEIAAAKAGIFKEGRPALIARQPESEAQTTLEECAQSAGCPVLKPQKTIQLQVSSCASQCQSALGTLSDGRYTLGMSFNRLQVFKPLGPG